MHVADIARRRLHNQCLRKSPCENPQEVLRRMGAMQAREFAYAKWSLAQRATGVDEAVIDRALTDGSILRTHILRPTWHFVLAEDIRWLLKVSAPRVHALNAFQYHQLGLKSAVFTKSQSIFSKVLKGGLHLSRLELASCLSKGGIDASGMRLAYIVMHAELEGLLCSGAVRGKKQTYVLLEERAPLGKTLDKEAALVELTRR